MKSVGTVSRHLSFLCKICLIVFIFQNCKVSDTKKSSKTASALAGQPQIVLSNSTVYVNATSYQLAFDIKGIDSSKISSVTCQLNENAATDCSSKTVLLDLAVDGNYSLKIVVQPKLGNKVELTKLIIKDSLAPAITVSSQPALITNQTTANFNFLVSENLSGILSVECSLDNANFQACLSPSALTNLIVGNHSYRIKATDRAGNVSPIYSLSWNIDLSIPTIVLTQMPKAISNVTNSSFSFSGVSTYECQLDTGSYGLCNSPVSFTNLSVGTHTFRVKGLNAAKVAALPIMYNWQVDNIAPSKPVITTAVKLNTNLTSAQFSFSATDLNSGILKYQCAVDSAMYADCANPKSFGPLALGAHTFKVVALDMAGNTSQVEIFNWMIDYIAPTVPTITTSTLAVTKSNTAQFAFNSTDAGSGFDRYECALDEAVYGTCTASINFSSLAAGPHQLKVKAYDVVGNASAVAMFNWLIDVTGPTISFTETPPKIFVGTQSNFKIQVTDQQGIATVKCNWISPVEASAPIDCSSGAVAYNLPPEAYILKVEATDKGGNVSVKEYGWDVDDGLGTILKFKFIKAGFSHVCGITLDDKVKCWGSLQLPHYQGSSVAIEKANITGVKSLAVTDRGDCALLNDSSVTCWGDGIGMNGAKGLTGVKSISASSFYVCALLEIGTVKCWGVNGNGVLGNNTQLNSESPVDVIGVTNAKEIFAGYNQACAILSNDTVKCWGGQILTAQEVSNLQGYKSLGLYVNQNCGINAQNDLMCWYNGGVPSLIAGISKVKSLATHERHTCAIDVNNKVICLGQENNVGALGSLNKSATLVTVPGLENVKMVTTGGGFSCVLTAEDYVKCWGLNSSGQLGYSKSSLSLTAVENSRLTNIKSIDATTYNGCAVTTLGTVKCWGNILGTGVKEISELPQQVLGLGDVKAISVSSYYSCAQHSDDTVSCWGSGDYVKNPLVPTKISGLTGVKTVEATYDNACAIMNNGTLKCWGSNLTTPVEVPNTVDIVKIASSGNLYCVLNSVGVTKCWDIHETTIPSTVTELSNYKFKELSGGAFSDFCGITFANEQVCFNISNPTLNLTNHGNVVLNSVQTSSYNSWDACILNDQGAVYCNALWGNNTYGKMGQNYTFAPNPINAFVKIPTPKPVSYVIADYDKQFFLYTDKTVGFIGKKYISLYSPSAVLKDPR